MGIEIAEVVSTYSDDKKVVVVTGLWKDEPYVSIVTQDNLFHDHVTLSFNLGAARDIVTALEYAIHVAEKMEASGAER